MNPELTPDSELLQRYALGTATPAEMQVVEAALVAQPELVKELNLLLEGLAVYGEQLKKTPPAALKARVMTALAQETQEQGSGTANGKARIAPQNPNQPRPVRALQLRGWLAAASVALLLSLGINLLLYNRLDDTRQRLALAESNNSELAQSLAKYNTGFTLPETEIALLQDQAVAPVVVRFTSNEGHFALVYWNKQNHSLHMGHAKLPALPAGKSYQLWALADGKPIDAGVIDLATLTGDPAAMKNIAAAQAFAITLEPAGGSTKPDGGPSGPLVAVGNVAG